MRIEAIRPTLALMLATTVILASCQSDSPTTPADDNEQHSTFPTSAEVAEILAQAEAAFPGIARRIDLTARYGLPPASGGHHLYALKISDNPGLEEDEPAFLMVSAHHGNEIGTPVVALHAIEQLTEGYGSDPRITALVDGQEIWIAPLWNPDGYPTSRRNGNDVDLNRNYPFLWDTECSGSTDPGSGTYRGPAAGSEPETRTMMAFSEDQRFTKVLDFHSSGRETLFAYRCSPHTLVDYLQQEAEAISLASSYGGDVRQPSAEGEHYQWQLGMYSNFAFLTEISTTQTPTFADALNEADRVWPGTLWMLERPVPVSGHVTDAVTGEAIEVDISYLEAPFSQGEQNRSAPLFGRYHAFLPPGDFTIRFEGTGYTTQEIPVTVTGQGLVMDVEMVPAG